MSRQFSRIALVFVAFLFFGRTVLSSAELVNVQAFDPRIAVELRYAGTNNVLGRALYLSQMPTLLRPEVVSRLVDAQNHLQIYGLRLKIWDAYRPKAAHDELWRAWQDHHYVADPTSGRGSLHSWGVAVDATLVYQSGKEVAMPTDFDDFTPAAMLRYTGSDPKIRTNQRVLQRAMARAGFYGVRTEWWHFIAKDWQKYGPIPEGTNAGPNFAPAPPRVPALRLSPAREPIGERDLLRRHPAGGAQLSSTHAR